MLILSDGLKWQGLGFSPEDAELLASRKFSVEEIARLYAVPPPLIQDYSHNTFTNSAAAGRWFAQFTLMPWARKIEAVLGRALFPAGSGYEIEIDLSGLLRGDPETRWAAHKIAIDAGILDADEVREIEGYMPARRFPNLWCGVDGRPSEPLRYIREAERARLADQGAERLSRAASQLDNNATQHI